MKKEGNIIQGIKKKKTKSVKNIILIIKKRFKKYKKNGEKRIWDCGTLEVLDTGTES